jgi:hypothetical protein
LKIQEKIICLIYGHFHTRFERRSKPTCLFCGPRRKRFWDRRIGSSLDDSAQTAQKIFDDLLLAELQEYRDELSRAEV